VIDIQTETETDVVQLPNILELLDWSNDGTRFTFYGSTIEGVLETIAIPNGGESTSRFAITQAFGDISFVSYSPDRTQLVYTATANFPSRRIQVFLANADCPLVNLESCRIRRVTEDSFNYAYPRFSPDGSRLLVSSDRSGNMDLYIMDLEGNIIDRLTESGFDEYDAVWQPIPR
jgi:Tol biopolymer transport system component